MSAARAKAEGQTEVVLLQKIAGGDRDAFSELYRRLQRPLFARSRPQVALGWLQMAAVAFIGFVDVAMFALCRAAGRRLAQGGAAHVCQEVEGEQQDCREAEAP